MKKLRILTALIVTLVLLPVIQVNANEQIVYSDGYFLYHIGDGYVSLCGYYGGEETVHVPSYIGGQPMSRIESGAFEGCSAVKTVVLPETVMEVQEGAFRGSGITQVIGYPKDIQLEPETEAATSEPTVPEEEPTVNDPVIPSTEPKDPSAKPPAVTVPQSAEHSAYIGEGGFFEDDPDNAAIENARNQEIVNQLLENGKELVKENNTKSEPENAAETDTIAAEKELPQKAAGTSALYLGILVAALAAAIGIVVVFRRKSN